MRSYPLLLAILLVASCGSEAAGQIVDPFFTPPSGLYSPGGVYAIGPQQSDGKWLLAGPFSRVNGTPVGPLVRLDAAGALDQPFSQNLGNASLVNRVKLLPSGQYLLSAFNGSVTAGNLTRPALLRLNSDGTADATFDAGSGPGGAGSVRDVAVQADGKAVVVGAFSRFNGGAAAGVVRLLPTGGLDATFNAGTGAAAADVAYAALVQADGKIVVGGTFAAFNGQPANGLVRLLPDGAVDPAFASPFNQSITRVDGVLQQPDGNLVVYGSLSVNSATHPSPGVVRLLPSGQVDPSFSPPGFLDASVGTGPAYGPAVVLQPDGKLVVTGSFAIAGAHHLARLNADGTQDVGFQTGVGPNVGPRTIGLQSNGRLLVGGVFAAYDGLETPLVQLLSTGTRDPAFPTTVQGAGLVVAMVRQPDNQIILGGNFTEFNGQPVHRLVRLSETGTLDAAFAAATGVLPGPVNSLALQADGRILAGTQQGTFRFASSGSPDASFSFLGSTAVLALQADGRLFIGGNFYVTANGVGYSRLVRVTSTGTVDSTFARPSTGTWVPNSTDALLIQPDGRLVVGGSFAPAGQAVATRVVRYETTGALDASFNNTAAITAAAGSGIAFPRVYALALQPDGKIVAGGVFGSIDGNAAVNLARLTAAGAVDPGFAVSVPLAVDGAVRSLAYQPNGRLLVGGSVSCPGPSGPLYRVIRVLADGQLDPSYGRSATPNNAVTCVLLQPDGGIMLGGYFTSVGSQPAFGVARVAVGNVLHAAASAAASLQASVWPVPAHDQLHLTPSAGTRLSSAELFDATGRSVRRFDVVNAAQIDLDIHALTGGIYFLRVEANAGSRTYRVAIE